MPCRGVSSPREPWFSLAVGSPSADKRCDQRPQLNSEPSKREGGSFHILDRVPHDLCSLGHHRPASQSFLVLSHVLIAKPTPEANGGFPQPTIVTLYYNTTLYRLSGHSSTTRKPYNHIHLEHTIHTIRQPRHSLRERTQVVGSDIRNTTLFLSSTLSRNKRHTTGNTFAQRTTYTHNTHIHHVRFPQEKPVAHPGKENRRAGNLGEAHASAARRRNRH